MLQLKTEEPVSQYVEQNMKAMPRYFVVLLLLLSAVGKSPAAPTSAEARQNYFGLTPLEWSVALADSETARLGDKRAWREGRNVKWDYTAGLFTLSLLKLNQQIPDAKFVEFSKDTIGSFVKPDGGIQGYKLEEYNIDNVAPGETVIALYELTKEDRYKKCADLLRKQLETHPRTSEGGFWHKQRYPSQMWLDGLFMGSPFYAEYALRYDSARAAGDFE